MRTTKVLYTFIVLLLALLSFLLVISHTRAADTYGGVPYPTEWNRAMVEIRWPQAPQADDYMCIFKITDAAGAWFIGVADTWIDRGPDIYARMYFNFTGNRWFLDDLYCVAILSGGNVASPDNPNTYYVNLISKIVLTLITIKH